MLVIHTHTHTLSIHTLYRHSEAQRHILRALPLRGQVSFMCSYRVLGFYMQKHTVSGIGIMIITVDVAVAERGEGEYEDEEKKEREHRRELYINWTLCQ